MTISKITAANLKGRKFAHKLGDMTLITGANDSGKTAVLDAVRLALLGEIPGQPKTNQGIFALSSGKSMTVTADIVRAESLDAPNAYTVQREWAMKGKSIKLTEHAVDSIPATPLVLLDPADFFGRSDKGRVDMLFSLLPVNSEEFRPVEIRKRVRAAAKETGEIEDFDTLLADAKEVETPQTWLERVAVLITEAIATANATAGRYEKTAQGISQLALADTPVEPMRVASDMRTATEALKTLSAEKGRLDAETATVGKHVETRRDLTQRIAELRARIGDAETVTLDTKALQDELNTAAERAGLLKGQHEAALAAAERASGDSRRASELNAKLSALGDTTSKLADAQKAVTALEASIAAKGEANVDTALREAEEQRAKLAAIINEQANVDKTAKAALDLYNSRIDLAGCPTCGAAGDHWKSSVEREWNTVRIESDAARELINSQYVEQQKAVRKAEDGVNRAQEAAEQLQKLHRDLGAAKMALQGASHANELATQLRSELDRLGNASAASVPVMPAELETLQTRVAQLRDQIERAVASDKLAQYQAELDKLPMADESAEQKVYRVECEIDATHDRIDELKKLEQKAQNQAADKKRLAESNEAREAQLTRAMVLKAIAAELLNERTKLVKKTVAPLLETAGIFTKGILPSALEFVDGEIGRHEGATFVPVRAFGGTHQAATYAGIQAALGAGAPVRIVLVDELGRMDPANKSRFLLNIRTALGKGVIEQFIACDVTAPDAKFAEEIGLTHIATK